MQFVMRKINTRDFSVATHTTSREIKRRIALNLIRERQPISRADLARYMNVTRGVISVLVQELIAQGVICEGATGEPARGRKPTFLHIRTGDRFAVGVDVRFSKTYLMLCDLSGRELAIENYDTVFRSSDQSIADTMNGNYVLRVCGLCFELVSQTRNVRILVGILTTCAY